MDRWSVGIFIFDGVEVLDFAGPYEVFSRTRLEPGLESRRSDATAPFRVFTVAAEKRAIAATGGLQVIPDFSFADAPEIDLVVIPGGFGVRPLIDDDTVRSWILATSKRAKRTASVCSGALLLAKAGLLDGKRATTHWGSMERLGQMGSGIRVEPASRFVDDGVLTSAGVSAGIDLAFHIVATLHGNEVAAETANYIEYPWPS